MIRTDYFGFVDIAYWEYVVGFFYVMVFYIIFARRKNVEIKRHPEYQYFMWGMFAKLFGGLFFCLIYFYYYRGGDTISYFYSAKALANLAMKDIGSYFIVLFGDNDLQNLSYFDRDTGLPYRYVYSDPRTYMVIRMLSPIVVFTFGSYLVTTLVVASISYFGVWRLYRVFVRYYPSLQRELAIGILFMPSVIFWGSGIMKDTITFSALCYAVSALDDIAFDKKNPWSSWTVLLISSFFLIAIKPYIFMSMFPVSLFWVYYHRLTGIRNALIKYLLLPFALVALMVGSVYVLSSLGDRLDKFSMEKALDTIVVTQRDMKRSKEYGDNYFDIGEIEPTWTSVLSKAPSAVTAALFRPAIFEVRNVVMLLSALENLFLFYLFVSVLWRARFVYMITMMAKNPLVLMCLVFSVFYGFAIGVSTPNFGALVRFKIPLIPFFVSGLYIMSFMLRERKRLTAKGIRFRFERFVDGEPRAIPAGRPTRTPGAGLAA